MDRLHTDDEQVSAESRINGLNKKEILQFAVYEKRRHRPLLPLIEHYYAETVSKLQDHTVDQDTGCWNLNAAPTNGRYGQISFGKRIKVRAHRLSYAFHNQKEPGPLLVCHTCDNPRCINPDHLWLGTDKQNAQDKAWKGRQHRTAGETNRHAKLTEDDVRTIRRMVANGWNNKQIARFFRVTHGAISLIRLNKTWRHVG